MRIAGGAQKKERGASRGPRSERRAVNSAGGDGGAKKLGFEKFGGEVGDGHRAPAQEPHHVFLAEAADIAAELQKFPKLVGGGIIDVGRREEQDLAKNRA
jgi:hypothetical protein